MYEGDATEHGTRKQAGGNLEDFVDCMGPKVRAIKTGKLKAIDAEAQRPPIKQSTYREVLLHDLSQLSEKHFGDAQFEIPEGGGLPKARSENRLPTAMQF